VKTSKNFFASTVGAAGCSGRPQTDGKNGTGEPQTVKPKGLQRQDADWKPHPKSAARPDFSSWRKLLSGLSGMTSSKSHA